MATRRKARKTRSKPRTATKRRARTPRATPRQKRKTRRVLGEFKERKLKSSSGRTVTKRSQAVAISLSEAGLSRKRRKKRS